LKFELKEGWHIYWRNPGDSGAKPTIDWTLPPGFAAEAIQWPYPERLPAGPLLNFGYEGEVLLPISVTPPTALGTDSVTLRAEADWLVCKIDCIPESGTLELQLPSTATTPKPDPRWIAQFDRARASLPKPLPGTATANATDSELALQIELPASAATAVERASFFPDFDGAIVNAAEQILETDRDGLTLRLQRGYLSELETLSGVLVLEATTDLGAIAQAFTVPPVVVTVGTPAPSPVISSVPLWQTFGLAFLGGIVLNLMPCVF
ncbi:MAG: protein-disulfide reductase DsbD domain-containing protein, partial [Cyanobacteria bacterium J06641_5]